MDMTATAKDFRDATLRISDDGDDSKKLAFQCSGITAATTRTVSVPDLSGLLGLVSNGADPPATGDIGKVDRTAQAADITTVKLTDTTAAGGYLVSCVLEDTTADVAAGTVTVTFSWTDDAGAATQAVTQSLALAGRQLLTFPVYLASGNVTWATTHTGIFGTSRYALRIRCQFLG
jgi:hypothetical protein